jgi:hypothetical protein
MKVAIEKNEPEKPYREITELTSTTSTHGGRNTQMREKTVEEKLVRTVRMMDGLAPKFVSPGMDGMPDRLILLPGGMMAFAELKAPGKKPRPLQLRRKRQLEALGFRVYVIDHPDRIGGVLDELFNEL